VPDQHLHRLETQEKSIPFSLVPSFYHSVEYVITVINSWLWVNGLVHEILTLLAPNLKLRLREVTE